MKKNSSRSQKIGSSLGALSGSFSVYIHIPFCLRKCPYCSFFSVPSTPGESEKYLDLLKEEIQFYRAFLGKGSEASTMYFGGGTPTMLTPDQWEDLLSFLGENIPISPSAEITVEANPESFTKRHADAWRKGRISRVSIGVQSFFDRDLLWLGRPHDASKACDAVRTAVREGFSVSADLMFGLGGQTLRSWASSVETALELGVEHISLYQLSIDEGCRWNSSPPPEERTGILSTGGANGIFHGKASASMRSPVFPCPDATAATTQPTGGEIPFLVWEPVHGDFSGRDGTGMRKVLRDMPPPSGPAGEAWLKSSRSPVRRPQEKPPCFCSGRNGAFRSAIFRTGTVRQYSAAFGIPSGGKLPTTAFTKAGTAFR